MKKLTTIPVLMIICLNLNAQNRGRGNTEQVYIQQNINVQQQSFNNYNSNLNVSNVILSNESFDNNVNVIARNGNLNIRRDQERNVMAENPRDRDEVQVNVNKNVDVHIRNVEQISFEKLPNVEPIVAQQNINVNPIEIINSNDNVNEINFIEIETPELNVPSVDLDMSIPSIQKKTETREKEVSKILVEKEENDRKGRSFEIDIDMPKLKLKSNSTSKSKVKKGANVYRQHVSISSRVRAKFSKVQKILKKRKKKSKGHCTVICYAF